MKKKKQEVSFGSYQEWFAWAWIGVFLLIALFHSGMFEGYGLTSTNQIIFEKPVLLSLIVSFFTAGWCAIHIISKKFAYDRRVLFAVYSILLPIVYLISSINGLSSYLSTYGVLVHFLLFIFFIAGLLLIEYERIIEWLPKVFLVFGYLVVIYGFLNLIGNVYLIDSLSSEVQTGVRISSIFQYANAYAVLLLILWIAILIEINRTRRIWVKVCHGAMLVPVLVSFLLTLSRGALIILPVVAIVTLLMFRLKQQLMMIIYSIVGFGLSLIIYSKLADRGADVYAQIQQSIGSGQPVVTTSFFNSLSLPLWGLLIGVTIVMGGLVYLLDRFVASQLFKSEKFSKSGLWLPLAMIVVFVIGAVAIATDLITRFLPTVIRERVKNINFKTHSVYERFTMYKDALKIWRHYPIFGGGGGAWEATYEKYQSYAYASNQTHSFITQWMVEVGIVGLVIILALIVAVLIAFTRYYRQAQEDRRIKLVFYFIVVVVVLLHSLIDFEMSYVFYSGLVFLSLGILAGTQKQEFMAKYSKQAKNTLKNSAAAIIGAVSLVILIVASMKLSAYNQFMSAVDEGSKPNASFPLIMKHLSNAKSMDKKNPVILIQIASWNSQAYSQTKDKSYLNQSIQTANQLLKDEPHYVPTIMLNYTNLVTNGSKEKAIGFMSQMVQEHPFMQNYYDQLASDLSSEWEEVNGNNQAAADQIKNNVLNLYQEMKRRDQMMKDLPNTVIPSRSFELSNVVRLALGKIMYDDKRYTDTSEILHAGLKKDLSQVVDRNVVLYYLAALRKQGQDDSALYNQLVQVDSSMAGELEQLLASK